MKIAFIMKNLKKLFILCIFLLGIFFFRGFFYRSFFKYESVGTRGIFVIEEFDKDKFKSENIDDIINLSLEKASENLEFKLYNPGKFLQTGKANCVGYSDYFSSYVFHLLLINDLDKDWKVHHEIGKLKVFGVNIHHFFNSNSFKDHDFVIIENVKTGEILAVDPSVYDYFKIDRISLNK